MELFTCAQAYVTALKSDRWERAAGGGQHMPIGPDNQIGGVRLG
jgi:hypothetical protein